MRVVATSCATLLLALLSDVLDAREEGALDNALVANDIAQSSSQGSTCRNSDAKDSSGVVNQRSLLQVDSSIHLHKSAMLALDALDSMGPTSTQDVGGTPIDLELPGEEVRKEMLSPESSESGHEATVKGISMQQLRKDALSLGQLVSTKTNHSLNKTDIEGSGPKMKVTIHDVKVTSDGDKVVKGKKILKINLNPKTVETALLRAAEKGLEQSKSLEGKKSIHMTVKPQETRKRDAHDKKVNSMNNHIKIHNENKQKSQAVEKEDHSQDATHAKNETRGTETLIVVDNLTAAPVGSQLQVADTDESSQRIFAKLRSIIQDVRKIVKGGGPPLTFLILCLVALIIFVLAIVRYNHPYFKDEEKKYYTDDHYSMLRGASNANYDTNASLKGVGTQSTPVPRQRPPAPADKFVSPQPVRLSPIQSVPARQLCPGLVVPQGNECILAVPIILQTSLEPITTYVKDMAGKDIIQADILSARALRSSSPQRPLAMLRAGGVPGNQVPQAPLLGYCVANFGIGYKSVSIHEGSETSHDEIPFASVQRESSGLYAVTSHAAALRWFFQGDFKNHSITVTNDKRELLAETAPHMMHFDHASSYYKLRVVAGVDVGLILFAMYSIDCMEFD